jgi:ribonucleoside-diphosphate reductase alpha chain
MPAKDLWRKMLSMLFETGHPWITFKDACNVRSPQQHVGVVHSSNLCTEITLNTSDTEIAVCNLGSVNLAQHLKDGAIDQDKLKKTVATAMRMLDNVIDINYYAVKKARDSNLRHRPVGLGIMGFQDCLYQLRLPYASDEAVEFADRSMEAVCYHAYWASTELAAERGRYSSYRGSLWDRGILPQDTLDLLAEAARRLRRGRPLGTMDWDALRAAHRRARHAQLQLRGHRAHGHHLQHHRRRRVDRAELRQPVGEEQPVGRVHGHQRVPGARPEALGLWDDVMVMDLKHFDGSLRPIDRVPEETQAPLRHRLRGRRRLAGGGCGAPPEVDRPGAEPEHLHGRRLGQEARRDLQAGLAARLKTTYYLRTTSATAPRRPPWRRVQLNAVRRQAHHQRPDRRQPAGAVQVQVGLGEVPRHLRQPLDAAGSEHERATSRCGRTRTA